MPHTFSAIIPNFNDSARIAESLSTLAAQTRPLDEIIIVDDASTDNSIEIIQDFAAKMPQLRLIRHKINQGVISALNTGIQACTSDFIFFCSANDRYDKHMVELCSQALETYPDACMVSGNAVGIDTKTQHATPLIAKLPQCLAFYAPEVFVQRNRRRVVQFPGGANALRRETVQRFGGLRPQLKWFSDWLMYQLIATHRGFAYVPQQLSFWYWSGEDNYSAGSAHWPQQKEVIRQFLLLLKNEFADKIPLFRKAAILPSYNFSILPMLCGQFRWYITPLLVWRIGLCSLRACFLNLFTRGRQFIPQPLLFAMRPLFRRLILPMLR